jgi:hypothetical protein
MPDLLSLSIQKKADQLLVVRNVAFHLVLKLPGGQERFRSAIVAISAYTTLDSFISAGMVLGSLKPMTCFLPDIF